MSSTDDYTFENFAQHLSRLDIADPTDEPFGTLATAAIHADDRLSRELPDVAPAMHLSTTYRYRGDGELNPVLTGKEMDTTEPIYARVASAGSNRYEQILSSILRQRASDERCYALVYSSGVAAFNGILTGFVPDRVVMPAGSYHGLHGALSLHQAISRGKVEKVTLARPFDSPDSWADITVRNGDLVLIETPVNPTGEIVDLEFVASVVRPRGAILVVDATLGPPPLQDPFALGADVVLHSGSKYFGGHSDMLCGIVAVRDRDVYLRMISERLLLGSTIGSMEAWLGMRSVRTLDIRVRRQSENAAKLVAWFVEELGAKDTDGSGDVRRVVEEVRHSTVQSSGSPSSRDGAESSSQPAWIKKQMPFGPSPVFSIIMKSARMAQELPRKLKLFHHATSLGGVESLIEWRRMTDGGVDPRLLRVSVGIENWADLKADFVQAFGKLG